MGANAVCVDDYSRLAHAQVLADEKASTAIVFLRSAVAFYAAHGITVHTVMTDTGSAYISVLHAIACRALGVRHIRIRPRRPRTNGKAERFIRTMLREWAYGAIYASSHERATALSGWLERYNTRRPHGSLGHKPPISRLTGTNLLGCQWPSVSPQLRPSVLPMGGRLFSPLVAISSPHPWG